MSHGELIWWFTARSLSTPLHPFQNHHFLGQSFFMQWKSICFARHWNNFKSFNWGGEERQSSISCFLASAFLLHDQQRTNGNTWRSRIWRSRSPSSSAGLPCLYFFLHLWIFHSWSSSSVSGWETMGAKIYTLWLWKYPVARDVIPSIYKYTLNCYQMLTIYNKSKSQLGSQVMWIAWKTSVYVVSIPAYYLKKMKHL